MKHSFPLWAVAAPLGLTLVASCGSSDSSPQTTAPPTGSLPEQFVVYTGQDTGSSQVLLELRDLATGEVRSYSAAISAGHSVTPGTVSLSPNGQFLCVATSLIQSTSATTHTRVINLANGVSQLVYSETESFGVESAGGLDPAIGTFSPDSQHLALAEGRDGGGNLVLMNADGTSPTVVSGVGEYLEGTVDWLPDSSGFVCVSVPMSSIADAVTVYGVDANPTFTIQPFDLGEVWIEQVNVSANGSTIAGTLEAFDSTERYKAFGIDVASGTVALFDLPEESNLDGGVAVSDDGRYLAATISGSLENEVIVMDMATGGSQAVLTSSLPAFDLEDLSWEPQGDCLAITYDDGVSDGHNLATWDPVHGLKVLNIPDEVRDEQLAWSPSGGKFAIVVDRSSLDEALLLWDPAVAPDPRLLAELGSTPGDNYPTWSRDGQWIVCNRDGHVTGNRACVAINADASILPLELGPPISGYAVRTQSFFGPEVIERVRFSELTGAVLWRTVGASGVDAPTLILARPGVSTGVEVGPASSDRIDGYFLREVEPASGAGF